MGHSTQLTASSTCGLDGTQLPGSRMVSLLFVVVLLNQSYKMFFYIPGTTQPKVKEKLPLREPTRGNARELKVSETLTTRKMWTSAQFYFLLPLKLDRKVIWVQSLKGITIKPTGLLNYPSHYQRMNIIDFFGEDKSLLKAST